MNQAWLSWQAGEAATATDILGAYLPEKTDDNDIRGFEWHYLDRLSKTGSLTLQEANRTPVESLPADAPPGGFSTGQITGCLGAPANRRRTIGGGCAWRIKHR